MQIMPDLFMINGFPFGRFQNGYALRTNHDLVLIDSGDLADSPSFDEVLNNLKRWNLDPQQVSHLLITHPHFDHSSHAARWQSQGVQIMASAYTASAMAKGDDRCVGYAVGKSFEPCTVDQVLEDGQEIEVGKLKITCLATPGHSPGCMIFQTLQNGQCNWFSGDLIMTGWGFGEQSLSKRTAQSVNIQLGWDGGPDYDPETYLHTLQKLKDKKCDNLFPGHGPLCIGGGKAITEKAFTIAMRAFRGITPATKSQIP